MLMKSSFDVSLSLWGEQQEAVQHALEPWRLKKVKKLTPICRFSSPIRVQRMGLIFFIFIKSSQGVTMVTALIVAVRSLS